MTSSSTAWEWRSQALVEGPPSSARTGSGAWPFRSYTCNFCNRAFRSAQALGGHMNVHRHDRARLLRPQASTAATILFPSPSARSFPCTDDVPLLGRPIVSAQALLGPDAVRDLCLLKSSGGGGGAAAATATATATGGGGGGSGGEGKDGSVVEVLDLELRLWW